MKAWCRLFLAGLALALSGWLRKPTASSSSWRQALLRGEFPRGDAARVVGASDRTVLTLAIEARLLVSDTPKASVRLGLPAKVHETSFPQLFPANQITGTT